MFNQKPQIEKSGLEKTIDELIREMATVNGDSDEYAKMADQLVKLYKLKAVDNDAKKQLSPDTLALVGGNLLGILVIVGYEQKNVVASKALNFLMKLR